MSKHAVIIGGGMGGLAAAARLAHAGWRVTLLEKNATVGGKLNLWEAPHPHRPTERTFRFDTGPSLLTLPQVFRELFTDLGKSIDDYLTLARLDPIARYVWSDGSTFAMRSDPQALREEVARCFPPDKVGFSALLAHGREIWDLSAELFLYHAPEQLLASRTDRELPLLDRLRRAWSLLAVPVKIGMFRKYHRLINHFIKTPRLREILYQYATYSGASPFKAPATLAVIPFAEIHFGGWYVQGGMYQLAEAITKLARDAGAEIRTNAPAAEILIDSHPTLPRDGKTCAGVVRGVRLADGSTVPADVVIANSDVVYTYRKLIPTSRRPRFTDRTLAKIEPGGSGMALLLGIDGTYPQLAHHTKFMPADYQSDLRAMFETRRIPDDPGIYLCASTRTDATAAPDGCENLFVLCSAPAIDGRIDWRTAGAAYRDRIVQTLEERFGLTDLSRRIVVERRFTPEDLQSVYNANAGSIYGISSNTLKNAFLRPPNRDRDVKGLYFAGGATHPGGGLPLVTLSAKIAVELVMEDQ